MDCSTIDLKKFASIFTHGKGIEYIELNSLLSSGNLKLPSTTAIFNMTPAKYCPALALGLCKAFNSKGKHICYALKAERGYCPKVLPYRIRQMKFWKKVTAEEFVAQFLLINSLKAVPYTTLRLNEAGDFHSQKCVDKAERIAQLLGRFGIKVYCYTHRSDLDYSGTKNLIVSGSNFMKEGVSNIFRIVENIKRDKPKGWSICPMDCTVCNKCMIRGQKIVVKEH